MAICMYTPYYSIGTVKHCVDRASKQNIIDLINNLILMYECVDNII